MSTKKIAVAFGALTLVAIVSFGVFFFYDRQNDSKLVDSENNISYAPSTQSDKQLNNSVKENAVGDEDKPVTTTTEGKRGVKPVISAWGQPGGPGSDLRINGYVPSIIEANGTCTVTLTKDSLTASSSKGALQNAQDTSCGQLIIAYSKLSPGTWRAVLTYNSTASEGSSDAVEIEVK